MISLNYGKKTNKSSHGDNYCPRSLFMLKSRLFFYRLLFSDGFCSFVSPIGPSGSPMAFSL